MSKIEQSLVLPLRRLTNPIQLSIGAAVTVAGTILALSHL